MRRFIIIEVEDEEEASSFTYHVLYLVVPVIPSIVVEVEDEKEASLSPYSLLGLAVPIISCLFFIASILKILLFTPLFH